MHCRIKAVHILMGTRYWDGRSQSPLRPDGTFKAAKFRECNIEPVPPPKLNDPRFFWDDIFLHLDKAMVTSPFIR